MYSIGIISRWNATCGVSMHAQLICNEFLKMGHRVKVFAPYVQSANRWWHHKIIKKDEDFVIRCYSELDPETKSGGSIEEDEVLSEGLDVLIVESYASLPYDDIERLVRRIEAKTIAVIHEGCRDDIRYTLDAFDAIVVFDERYQREVVYGYEEKTRVIPYPCHPVRRGNRRFAEDVLTFFSFGRQPVEEYHDFLRALDGISSKYDFVYRVVRSNGLLPFTRPWLEQEQKRLSNEEIYEYLHPSDVHLLPKGNTKYTVVSSTLFLCMGSLVPTVVPNTRHFESLPEINGITPAVIYSDVDDLKEKLIRLIEDEDYRKGVLKAAEEYVEENRSDKIAAEFVKLFEDLTQSC
ncbi:MAG TPA: glycosyltransferase family 4 protein [Methermicoccus shengliensis]|uniref:Glycosyltransferase family 4 protein n=2 Tax=Methermicoccus shengliensis TaxID=660064 RepID=A0A832VXS4_9EURY|nr:MAG: hypothetical protein XD46_0718 [Euryarchaeota archaeon 55_53]KUK29995.1 MAG: hypothetical protein XD62_0937 [Methanosarcinales archeaon 56_1174]MDN5294935.1 hypothetical protein [Methanosarcinales archaeon]HIH70127.1 glycosyltransferase family 4 protein [Methermicoccus shengliensis]